jgi:hypothetical protein
MNLYTKVVTTLKRDAAQCIDEIITNPVAREGSREDRELER